jgi:hypothetical protein
VLGLPAAIIAFVPGLAEGMGTVGSIFVSNIVQWILATPVGDSAESHSAADGP